MESKQQKETSKKYIPWWLYLFIAIVSYTAIKFFLPTLASNPADREQFAELGSQVAPIIAIIFLLLAANALYRNVPKSNSDKPEKQTENDKQ